MRLGNVEIPCPGCRGVASIRKGADGVRIVKVDLYSPSKPDPISLPGIYWDVLFPDEESARNAISKDLANNPVKIVDVSADEI